MESEAAWGVQIIAEGVGIDKVRAAYAPPIHVSCETPLRRQMFSELLRATEANRIETVVSKTFKFADAPAAYAYFAAQQQVGKVLIEFD
nr:zinc-binding dehydrogenase [Pseudomonas sp. Bi70]